MNNNNNNNNLGSGAPGVVKNEISYYQLTRLRGREKKTHKQSVVGTTVRVLVLVFSFIFSVRKNKETFFLLILYLEKNEQ